MTKSAARRSIFYAKNLSFTNKAALANKATTDTKNSAGMLSTHAKVADKNATKVIMRLLDMTLPSFLLITPPLQGKTRAVFAFALRSLCSEIK